MPTPKLEIWHRPDEPRRPFPSLDGETVRARCSRIESAFDAGLHADDGPRAPARAGERTIGPPNVSEVTADADLTDRLAEHERDPGEPVPVPLLCRMPFDCDDPSEALEVLPEEIYDALDGAGRLRELDPHPLATALHELGAHSPAVALLERAIRRRGATLAACELMGKCLQALDRPDLAMLWFLRPLSDPDLELEARFELVRQASTCQMEMQLMSGGESANEPPGEPPAEAKAA